MAYTATVCSQSIPATVEQLREQLEGRSCGFTMEPVRAQPDNQWFCSTRSPFRGRSMRAWDLEDLRIVEPAAPVKRFRKPGSAVGRRPSEQRRF
ncbi:MAG: hypothetical protein R2729_25935 [Bryobacteraceae bacterium]